MSKYLYCPNYSVPLNAYKHDEKQHILYRARCKQWDCPYCAEINRRVWMARIWKQVEKDITKHWTFFTFTLLGKNHGSTLSSLLFWRDVWDKFMKRLKREYGSFSYLRVFEPHKSGALHVHMLADFTVPDAKARVNNMGKTVYESEVIKTHLNALKMGYIHDCREIVPDDREDGSYMALVASYVGKYMTKDIQSGVRKLLKDAGLSRIRMIQTSLRWAKLETQENNLEWSPEPIRKSEFEANTRHDWQTVDVDKAMVIIEKDFYEYQHYPNKTSDLFDLSVLEESE